jgi:starvation-inducible DNA-binding protein
MALPKFTVPSMTPREAQPVIKVLEERLVALVDTTLTIKHIHWNVVGPHFIAAHEMLDDHFDRVSAMVDQTAERIATMGGTPIGTPGHLVAARTWDDYSLGKASVPEHMAALDVVYTGLIEDHRAAETKIGDKDRVTQDMLLDHLGKLELLQWFVRAHVESSGGELVALAGTEQAAARKARAKFAK